MHEEIARLIAAARFEDREQELLESIRQDSESMRTSFLKLVSDYKRHSATRSVGLLKEAEEQLAGQLTIRSHHAALAAARLENMIDDEIITTQKRISALTLFLIIAVAVPLTVESMS